MVWAMAFSLMMFIVVVSCTTALGSFDDYKELEYLVPTLPIVLIGFFILRPAKAFMINPKATNTNDTCRQAEEGHQIQNNNNNYDESSFTETNIDSPTQSLTLTNN